MIGRHGYSVCQLVLYAFVRYGGKVVVLFLVFIFPRQQKKTRKIVIFVALITIDDALSGWMDEKRSVFR